MIYLLVFTSGLAALSWEVLWQIKTSLALGASALGTSLTLAVTMGGLATGALCMGQRLRNRAARPLRMYGVMECLIGIAGLFLGAAFAAVEKLDTLAYALQPQLAPVLHVLSIIAVLGLPTTCMGATLPLMGLMSRRYDTSIAILYGLNTLGAAGGCLLAAFCLIPLFGIQHASWLIGATNLGVGVVAWLLDQGAVPPEQTVPPSRPGSGFSEPLESLVVFTTGFAVLALEVAWFRSLTAAFHSTTAAFAIMLASVLLALGYGARLVPRLKAKAIAPASLLGAAGILVLLVTPVVERFDLLVRTADPVPAVLYLQWFFLSLIVLGTPILLMGILLPWVLDDQHAPGRWGRLYGLNTVAAILGSLCAGWVMLPTIGFARTAWLIGVAVVVVGLILADRRRQRMTLVVAGVAALAIAHQFESGVGRSRIQIHRQLDASRVHILRAYEGPDVTVSAIEYADLGRILVIDGFITTSEADLASGKSAFRVRYMAWMGHLPMLLHPDPERALVIAFGTGQTANALRREQAGSVDVVEINRNVLRLAPYFNSNEDVLQDPRVHPTIMDGRTFLRRVTGPAYDVITLEPMPPTFAGVNALYSEEFYRLARNRLTDQGLIAQWLPIHLLHPDTSQSIARTFQHVFPNAMLWLEPASNTGILVGARDATIRLGEALPGYQRPGIERDFSPGDVREAIALDRHGLARYAHSGVIITDDNQRLAYGEELHSFMKGDWPANLAQTLAAIAAAAEP